MDRSRSAVLVVRMRDLPPDAGTPLKVTDDGLEPVEDDDTPRLQFLGQKSGVQGLRVWCDTIEDSRVEWFPASRTKAIEAASTYGGILVESRNLDKIRLDDTWMKLEPAVSHDAGMGLA